MCTRVTHMRMCDDTHMRMCDNPTQNITHTYSTQHITHMNTYVYESHICHTYVCVSRISHICHTYVCVSRIIVCVCVMIQQQISHTLIQHDISHIWTHMCTCHTFVSHVCVCVTHMRMCDNPTRNITHSYSTRHITHMNTYVYESHICHTYVCVSRIIICVIIQQQIPRILIQHDISHIWTHMCTCHTYVSHLWVTHMRMCHASAYVW